MWPENQQRSPAIADKPRDARISVDPQADAVSRIRRRIFVRRKSAEYAIRCQLAKFSSRKIGQKYVIHGFCASWIDVFNCWAGGEQQALEHFSTACFVHDA